MYSYIVVHTPIHIYEYNILTMVYRTFNTYFYIICYKCYQVIIDTPDSVKHVYLISKVYYNNNIIYNQGYNIIL